VTHSSIVSIGDLKGVFQEDNPIPTGIHTGMVLSSSPLHCSQCFWVVLPSIGDESLQASIEVFNPDKPKKTKTGKRKSVSADASRLSLLSRVIPHAKWEK